MTAVAALRLTLKIRRDTALWEFPRRSNINQEIKRGGLLNTDSTIRAIEEVQMLKKDPNKRVYNSFSEVLKELDNEPEDITV